MIRPLSVLIACLMIICPAAMGQGSVVAHGGGADWELQSHREMVRWMIEQARPEGAEAGEGGAPVKVVILGAVPREPTDPDTAADAFRREGAEATAMVIVEANADSPETGAAIEAADIVWIRGGNQWRYVNWWKGTATERAIRAVFEKGGVVGGTSAGCAVLGEVTYDARNGSLRPEQALADPYHENLTLTEGFLGVVPGVLFDSHFTERGRIGRLPVMMARARVDFGKDVMGVGIDHETALMIDAEGKGTVIGSGTVGFLRISASTRTALKPGEPPLVADLGYDRLAAGGLYDLRQRKVASLPQCAGIHIALARPGSGRGEHLVAETWSRDGKLEERVEQAHTQLMSVSPSSAVLLDPGLIVEDSDGEFRRIKRVDGQESPPVAAVCLFHSSQRFGEKNDRNRSLSRRGVTSRYNSSFCDGVLSVLPDGSLIP